MDNFHKTELSKALSEVQYGIGTYRINDESCDSHSAVALVDLLEQQKIRIRLSIYGYEALDTTQPGDDSAENQIFEILENLLSHFSPMFRARHSEHLMNRLFELKDNSE